MTTNDLHLQIKVLNKLYYKFFIRSNMLNISSYRATVQRNFLNTFKRKINYILYMLARYIDYVTTFLKMYTIMLIMLT